MDFSLLMLLFIYQHCTISVFYMVSCLIIFTACFISCLISDHQKAGWDSEGNGTLAYLCWQRVWSGAHKCADSPGRSRTGHDGRRSGEKMVWMHLLCSTWTVGAVPRWARPS